jgi:hypothetical protein
VTISPIAASVRFVLSFDPSDRLNGRVWHPWLRVNRLIRDVVAVMLEQEDWRIGSLPMLRRALTERIRTRDEGWFS